jgi:hypothetical protein
MGTNSSYLSLNSLVRRPRLNNSLRGWIPKGGTDLSVFAAPVKGFRVKAIVQLSRQIGNGTDAWTCDAGARGQHLLVDVTLPHDIAAATWLGTLKGAGAV